MSKIRLEFPCPGSYQGLCSNYESIKWVHSKCYTPVFIDEDGDVTCESGCYIAHSNRFIQNWRFNCGDHYGSYVGYSSFSDLANAISVASAAIANYYEGYPHALSAWMKNLINSISERWEQ